ncbi:GPR107 [Bugula neritina]|uniref:GPR107 n=1 Tax=Bugula neritina TaxID=10212 RepID=A0A7J7ISR6_BUGNE|nr:GPR107 [Bugula neritina]
MRVALLTVTLVMTTDIFVSPVSAANSNCVVGSWVLNVTTHHCWEELNDDQRDLIHLVDYGMFDGGTLAVDLAVTLDPDQPITQVYNKVFGLTIDRNKQSSAQIARYGESVNERTDDCALKSPSSNNSLVASFILVPVGSQSVMRINRTNELKDLKISEPPVWAHGKAAPSPEDTSSGSKSRDSDNSTGDVITTAQTDQVEEENNNTDTSSEEGSQLVKREVTTKPAVPHKPTTNRLVEIPLTVNSTESSVQMFQVSFLLTVTNKSAAGLYSIYFHNCAKLGDGTVLPVKVLAANITGRNNKQNTYLSAGDIPEPYLFFSVCVAYVILSFVWLRVLRSAV